MFTLLKLPCLIYTCMCSYKSAPKLRLNELRFTKKWWVSSTFFVVWNIRNRCGMHETTVWKAWFENDLSFCSYGTKSTSRSHGRVKWSLITATITTHPNVCRMGTWPALSSWWYTTGLAPFLISSTCTLNVTSTWLRTVSRFLSVRLWLLWRFFAPGDSVSHSFALQKIRLA